VWLSSRRRVPCDTCSTAYQAYKCMRSMHLCKGHYADCFACLEQQEPALCTQVLLDDAGERRIWQLPKVQG
jgi:hypothetical protein